MGLDVRVLGRLEVVRDGTPVELGAFRQRALLGLLVANAGTVLSTDRIIDALWGESAGSDKQASLWAYVSGLRNALEPARAKRSEGTVLLTRAPGYVLSIVPADTDAGRFEQLVSEARALVDDDPAAAASSLRDGLALWRGHAYEEFVYESWAQGETSRLDELRLEAIEDRIDADQRGGRSGELVVELQALVRQHPTRQRLVMSSMLALHRAGRSAEALRACETYRRLLVTESGVEPSRAVRELEQRILAEDPGLMIGDDRRGVATPAPGGPAVRGYELRDELGRDAAGTVYRAYQPAVGREVAITVIAPELADDPGFIRRFDAEAQLLAGLEHPHIVPLYDYWRQPGAAYLVMRMVGGGTLAGALGDGRLTPDRAETAVSQIAGALGLAHRHGVVHGDVRPENVLIDGDGNAYLTGFRVASTGDTEPSVASDLDGLVALAQQVGVLGVTADGEIENPYHGLRAFGAADASSFFGRQRLVERLLARLGEAGTRGRFVAVVGPSGSGKSSLVRAGLLPALARGALPTSAEWYRIEMTPSVHPFEQLEAALVGVAVTPTTLLDQLLAPGGVRRAVAEVLPDDESQLVVVIDQFEELFTQADDDTAERFIDELVGLVTAPDGRARVVITLRADYYDRPLAHRGLGELLAEGTEVITPMSSDELHLAITGPAAAVGVGIEPAVVSEMVAAVTDQPAALPLLQFTLTELFEDRIDGVITLDAYRACGGVSRTLARRADALLAGLGPDNAETVRRVFLRLVSVDDDVTAAETRRRVLVSDVDELATPGRVGRVLDTFGRHRLLTFDRDPISRGPTVEISHEALLTEWTTLREWIADARDDLRAHRHLVTEMRSWTAADRSPDYLLRGARLDATVAWAGTTTMGLRPAEHDFLDASVAARAAEAQAREEDERRTASAEHRARRRTRQLAIAGLATALVAVLAVVVWVQRQDARRAEGELAGTQQAHRLANLSVTSLPLDPELSVLLAVEAVRATTDLGYAVPEAIDATHWALQELGVQYDVTAETPTAARLGPRGVQGVWMLPVDELVRFAEASTDRTLTAEECQRYLGTACPPAPTLGDLDYLGGTEAYADAVGMDEAEVVVAISAGVGEQVQDWERNLEVIRERYDLDIRLVTVPQAFELADAAAEGFDADVYHLTGPGDLPAIAELRPLPDLGRYLDEATLVEDFGRLTTLTRIAPDGTWPSDSGPIHAVVAGADSKALFWTKEPEFTDLGYAAPPDWASLRSLADRMVAEDRTPFCLEMSPGEATGWPATDWVEMVVLRTAGPEFYESWIRHEVPFDAPEVVDAIRTVGELVHTPGYLDISPEASLLREWPGAVLALAGSSDACLMTPFPSFLPGFVDGGVDPPVDSFAFPGFGAGYDDAVVGGGALVVPVTDRPEVRTLMAALASPDWGVGAAQLDWPLLLPASARFDLAGMRNPKVAEIVSAIQTAIRSGNFQFDGSDSMPTDVSRAFLDGMVRLFRDGSAEDVDALAAEIAAEIEAAWLDVDTAD